MGKSRLAVVDGHTLGVIDPRTPDMYTTIATLVSRGAQPYSGLAGTVHVPAGATVRAATHADLTAFRVFYSTAVLNTYSL